jgi:hypothetical protein
MPPPRQYRAVGAIFMKHAYLLILLVLGLYSCNFRIYSDDKKIANIKQDNRNWKSTNDSCLVFQINDFLPDSLVYINTTKIRSPFIWINQASPNNVMTGIAKNQAAKLNANVIKVTGYGGLNYLFTVKMYRLNNSLWTEFKNKKDSADKENKRINKNFCIIHIRSFCWVGGPLYFNDSLIGNFHSTTHKRTSAKIHALDIKLNCDGRLSAHAKIENNWHNKGFWLTKGNEYYISLEMGKYGNYLQKINKNDYY